MEIQATDTSVAIIVDPPEAQALLDAIEGPYMAEILQPLQAALALFVYGEPEED
jgi:hypothetical protein